MRQTILIIDDDRLLTEGLALALEKEGRTLVICPDVESADLALDRFSFTSVISDIQFSGPFGFEGLHFLKSLRKRLPSGDLIVMTGYAGEELRTAVLEAGASAVLGKPVDIDELERLLDPGAGHDSAPFELVRVPTIEELLASRTLTTVFQPIVRFGEEKGPYAFEALTRAGGWPLGGPAELFDYAARRSYSTILNRAAMIASIEAAAELPGSSSIFINIDPSTFSDPELVTDLESAAARANISLDRIVLEITEKNALGTDDVATDAFEVLRAHGVRFALDDHGSAYSHLTTIEKIRPSVIKISQVFGTDFEADETKLRVVRHVVALARDFGCSTVLEGIESPATAAAAAALGIELAQGYFFSRPQTVSHWCTTSA